MSNKKSNSKCSDNERKMFQDKLSNKQSRIEELQNKIEQYHNTAECEKRSSAEISSVLGMVHDRGVLKISDGMTLTDVVDMLCSRIIDLETVSVNDNEVELSGELPSEGEVKAVIDFLHHVQDNPVGYVRMSGKRVFIAASTDLGGDVCEDIEPFIKGLSISPYDLLNKVGTPGECWINEKLYVGWFVDSHSK